MPRLGRLAWGLSAVLVGLLGAWVLLGPAGEEPVPDELTEVSARVPPAPSAPAGSEATASPPPRPSAPAPVAGGSGAPEAAAGSVDPTEPRAWHARADGRRWRILASSLEAIEHPLAPVAADLAERVAAAGPHLDDAAWRDLLQEEAQLLGYLSSQELEEGPGEQVQALQGALRALGQGGPPG